MGSKDLHLTQIPGDSGENNLKTLHQTCTKLSKPANGSARLGAFHEKENGYFQKR